MAISDPRLSVRVQQETLDLIEKHRVEMEKQTGTRWTKTQAVESLIQIGFLTWQATVRSGLFSPAVLIARGAEPPRKKGGSDE
jgi:hypothetical protein